LQFGRQRFADSAGLIAGGLFDGINGSLALGSARLSLGAFYTGFLYKESLEILLTPPDNAAYAQEVDYSSGASFADTYFASRRVLVPISLALNELTERTSLVINLLGQFDVNGQTGDGDTLHSQYLEAHYFIEPVNPLHLDIAFIAEIAENPTLRAGFAAAAGVEWELPSALQDLLSLQLHWSSGKVNDTVGAFLPINGISPGEIFTPRFSGVMNAALSYSARLHNTLSAEGGFGYFIRTDTETLEEVFASTSRALGGELYASVIWAPQSALRLTASGGAFFPQMGKAFPSDEKIRGKAKLSVIVSF
jgi:hypothetical protein